MPSPSVGVFCLEGEWECDLRDRTSVVPTLDLLERLGGIKYIRRDVATRDELTYYFDRLRDKRYEAFRVVELAMHGDSGCLWLNQRDKESVSLMELAELMNGSCKSRDIVLASCSTLDASDADLDRFLQITGARLVCGYRKKVDWVEGAALEVLLLANLAETVRRKTAERRLTRPPFKTLTDHVGLRFHYR